MARFQFDFSGYDSVGENEFFGHNFREVEGREPTFDDIQDVLYDVTPSELMDDWGMSGCITVRVVDTETGAVWQYDGLDWHMVRDRKLLPGEQRLFD